VNTALSETDVAALDVILGKYRREPGDLVQVLRETQDALDYIPPAAMAYVATALGVPIGQVQAVTAFYAFFHDRPMGRYRVLFSDNITDRMLGSMALVEHMLSRLKLKQGEPSADGLVSRWGTTSCTGMCDQGPAMLVNNRVHHPADAAAHQRDLRADPQPTCRWPICGRASTSRSTTTSAAPTCCWPRSGRRVRRWRAAIALGPGWR
jgi:[NiFe] hydrogenase diaphorase moiety large subunit